MKKVILLGASGSIGEQSLDILEKYARDFSLIAFSVGKRYQVIDIIIKRFPSVKAIYLINDDKKAEFEQKYQGIAFFSRQNGIKNLLNYCDFDIVINALIGFVGLEPSLITLMKNKTLCLANKESLVTGGHLIRTLLKEGKGEIFPIDSEHVAISKCLAKVKRKDVKEIVLTASGGALRNISNDELKNVTPELALNHPTWKMGKKITIDSATLMNKGFEIVEAYYLFDFPLDKIKVILHDESLVHSFVVLNDGMIIADYGKPDMHACIEYALTRGEKCNEVIYLKDLSSLNDCHFRQFNIDNYPLVKLAEKCLSYNYPSSLVALNASDEVFVEAFLEGKITYLDIIENINKIVLGFDSEDVSSFEKISTFDQVVRKKSKKLC